MLIHTAIAQGQGRADGECLHQHSGQLVTLFEAMKLMRRPSGQLGERRLREPAVTVPLTLRSDVEHQQ